MRITRWLLVSFLAGTAVWFSCRSIPVTGGLTVGRFENLSLYRRSAHPHHVAVFISGDGGWHNDLAEVAEDLSKMDYLVIGVDISRYFEVLEGDSSSCIQLASDFHGMVRSVEDRLGYEHPVSAVVIGHSAGASMVYGILMQASPGSFRGGVSLGFSPGYESPKPFCSGPGLISSFNDDTGEYDLETAERISVPWIAIHGTADDICPFRDAAEFVQKVKGAKFVSLTGADHSITAPKMVAALKKALHQIAG